MEYNTRALVEPFQMNANVMYWICEERISWGLGEQYIFILQEMGHCICTMYWGPWDYIRYIFSYSVELRFYQTNNTENSVMFNVWYFKLNPEDTHWNQSKFALYQQPHPIGPSKNPVMDTSVFSAF